jgi:hypothetical protein
MEALEDHLLAQIEHSRNFFWHRLRWRALLFHLPRDRSFTVVDVGAGAGLLGDQLSRLLPAARYGFVEPIESLERRLVDRFGTAANFRERDRFEGVGYVTLMDVVEHIEDDRGFLAELTGKLEPGARLVITVPALTSLWSGWDVALGHFRRYDKPSLRRAVAGLPLREIESSYLHPEMLPLAWVRKLRRPAGGAVADAEEARFPDPPRLVNDLLYLTGLPALHLRRISPFGTTLFSVFERLPG